MIEYILIITATLLFSIQFLFTKKYQLTAGEDLDSSFFYKMTSPLLLIICLFIYNGFRIEYTFYSLILAFVQALIAILFSVFSIKALSKGSVVNYSLYLMSGGMIIPVIYGVLFGDSFGIWKILSIFTILFSIFIKYDKKEKTKKGAYISFFALFILNGMVGVIASLHQKNPFNSQNVSAVGFSLLSNGLTVVLSIIVFWVYYLSKSEKKGLKTYFKVSHWAIMDGFINGIANVLLLLALLKIEPSVQYPLVTGGCIFLSMIFGFLVYKEKPNKKAIISVLLAIIGSILIVL